VRLQLKDIRLRVGRTLLSTMVHLRQCFALAFNKHTHTHYNDNIHTVLTTPTKTPPLTVQRKQKEENVCMYVCMYMFC